MVERSVLKGDNAHRSFVPRVSTWWKKINEDQHRGSRAELRRSKRTTEVLFVPLGMELVYYLKGYNSSRVAALAAILAHVKEDNSRRIARDIGRKKFENKDDVKLSEVRFKRLLQIETADELLLFMVRVVRQLKGVVNVEDMAESVIFWNLKCKERWAFDYYACAVREEPSDPAASINGGG